MHILRIEHPLPDYDDWKKELESQGDFFEQMGQSTPESLLLHRKLLMSRLNS